MSTVQNPSVAAWNDRWLEGTVLWSMSAVADGVAHVVPDLSIDLVWMDGDRPRVTPRTVTPLVVPLTAGARSIGLRLPPAVVGVHVDWTWPGWRVDDPPAADRLAAVRGALKAGAVTTEVDTRLDAVLGLLDVPDVRIPAVAGQLGVSQRQLLRWTRRRTGLSPKQLHRMLRVRRLCETDDRLGLTGRALQAGFADHAHACGEVRAIAGTTFSELVRWATARTSKTRVLPRRHAGRP